MQASAPLEIASLQDAEILVVDDGEQYVEAIKSILLRQGYRNVRTLTDPLMALDSLLREIPDLLILDLHMPKMNGIQLLMELQKAKPIEELCPVLVLTGDTDPSLRDTALALGTMDYLNKPFRQAEVVLRVKNLLRMRLLHKEVKIYATMLEEKVSERTEQLKDAYLDTIFRLAKAAEFRDDDTGQHIQRVGNMAANIARKMGVSEEFAVSIFHAAQLHDIGKIGVPDAILLKPARLSEQEFDILRKHTLIGSEILRDSTSSLLQLAGEVALTHHERWNGSGYPHGLEREEIPLSGRITAVADVFDALTHQRPYKQAWTQDDAIKELRGQQGVAFDPDVLDAFLELADD